jgi:hypothetical protein
VTDPRPQFSLKVHQLCLAAFSAALRNLKALTGLIHRVADDLLGSRDMKTVLSIFVALATFPATEVLAQAPDSAVQDGREFHLASKSGKAHRSAGSKAQAQPRAQAQRRDRRDALGARAQQRVAAPAAFDGSWSVAINTQSGACDPSYRFGVQIIDGNVVYEGRSAGRVSSNGGVWVNVSQGGQSAAGQGRLSRNYGTGVWRGYGSAGTCAGTWQAQRR